MFVGISCAHHSSGPDSGCANFVVGSHIARGNTATMPHSIGGRDKTAFSSPTSNGFVRY